MIKYLTFFASVTLFTLSCTQKTKEVAEEKPAYTTQINTFNYSPPPPGEDAVKMGAIVIGSAGFDAFVIECDTKYRWRLIEAKYGESKIISDDVSLSLIENGIKDYVSFLRKNAVTDELTHIIISSSAIKNNKAKSLLISIVDELPYQVKIVTENEEALFGFKAVIPNEFIDEAFMMDIGSGNTKISWQSDAEVKTEVSHGSAFHRENIPREKVSQSFKNALKKVPKQLLTHCFLIGGAPYEIAQITNKFDKRYTVYQRLDEYELNSGKAQSCLFILQELKKNYKVQNYIFDHHSNFGIGYLLSVNYAD